MTLRTQGGKILTQGGKLACDCCGGGGGGWYCFKQCDSCETGAIPAAVRVSVTYTMGDGSTTFSMRLRRMQTDDQVMQGQCPDFLGRSAIWPINQDGDPTVVPRITFTRDGGIRPTFNVDIGLSLSFTDSCAAGNAVRIGAGDNLFSTFHWSLVTGGSVSNGADLVNGNTFTGPPFVSAAATGLCYGDYPGSGPIPIKTVTGTAKDYYGTLAITVTGVE